MTDKERLDFIELVLRTEVDKKTCLSVGFKKLPQMNIFTALVGTVYIEGALSLRDLIDKMKRINDEEEPVPQNANTSNPDKE